MKTINHNPLTLRKGNVTMIGLSVLILVIAFFFREPLYGIFGEQNYLMIHLIMEFLIITIAFTIAIQSWMIFPHILSSFRLWIGAMFFSIGIIEVAHAITYEGMPFFLSESSSYKATWFFMIARLTEVLALLVIVSSKDRVLNSKFRYIAYGIALIYSAFWIVVFYYPTPLFPNLVEEGIGTTTLKNNLQYFGIIMEFVLIYIIIVRFRSKEVFNYMLIAASVYLIIGDYFFTTYKSVYDINNFVGHWFQLTGFYFLQRAVYHSSVEEPFQRQKQSDELLKKNEKFLQTVTANMGEGLIVMDNVGNLTYMNHEAERILGWKQEELLGKNVHDYIHRLENGSHFPYHLCPSLKANQRGEVYRVSEDYFIRKNGKLFPVAYVATPLYEDGKAAGAITVFRDITKMKKDQEMIHYMAFYDEMTSLPNIRYLKEKWEEILDFLPKPKTAVLILDINRFKNINEALGHTIGDIILEEVAKRLKHNLSDNQYLFRLTGDEFLLLVPSGDEKRILKEFENILSNFRDPLQVQHLLLNVSVSCGVAFYPENGTEIDTLLQHANIALMEAQSQNKSIQFYQPYMDGKALDNLVFENDLFHALSKNQLHIVYQPQVDLDKGEIIGLEALLRWYHPTHGWISPGRFIAKAEETGLIIPIGEWVLRTACQQMKQWHNQGLSGLRIAVNLSIRQFYQQNLVDKVKDILQETNLAPEYLELEVTESMMMNIEHSKRTLDALKELGIQISIDDFGTGYSSLSYLKHLPVNRLKIDQSFVRDLVDKESDMTIISAIISMSHFLNLEVIAEGVETIIQKEMLHSENCTQIQGYLISKPLTPEELSEKFQELQQKAYDVARAFAYSKEKRQV